MMDSDQSFSGDSNNSSENSNSSSDGEEEAFEPVRLLGHTLELPQDLCEDHSIFKEFFSMTTWGALDDKTKLHLKKFLPKFPENDEAEKEQTVKMLFDSEPFKFTSPLDEFYNNLKQGNYRPDIAKMKSFLLKARTKQQRHKMKSYYAKLLPEILISRERLLAAAISAPPGPAPRLPLMPPKPSKNNYRTPHVRAKQRYFEELDAINTEVGGIESEDDNYPEGSPVLPHKKKIHGPSQNDGNVSSTLGGYDPARLNSLEGLKHVLAAHKARRQFRENHPELNTAGITLEDIKQRVAFMNGAKKLMFGGPKVETGTHKLKRGPKKDPSGKKQTEPRVKKIKVEPIESKPLVPSIKIKSEKEDSDSESSSFVDPVASPRSLKRPRSPESIDIKKEFYDSRYPDSITNTKADKHIKRESHDSKKVHPVPIKLEDLDGIDMMDLPVELAEETVVETQCVPQSHQPDDDKSLMETTYANFLCLVRALFPARAAHRASKQQLKARCAAVMRSPIAPLNTWYHLSDNWCAGLESALEFLAGARGPHPDDFVPYLQYLPDSQMYQWIGAGRDCDAILQRLCDRWLRAASPQPPPINNDAPPPKYPTSWTVRAPTSAELAEFRSQERKRFASATKPFTYVQHGYRSPVGGCGRAVTGGESALVGVRPRVVCVTALVRDAVARLPNGEGTTHHILTLFKMSQYVASQNDQLLLSVITAALDKLIAVKRDPFVKYDKKTATWTYLHRHKSEEDWAKPTGAKNKQKQLVPKVPTPEPPPISPPEPPHMMELEHLSDVEECAEVEVVESGSDVEVDVEDAEEHVSQAQLLRQAATGPAIPPNKQTTRNAIHAPNSPNVSTQPQQTKTNQTVTPVTSQPQQITKINKIVTSIPTQPQHITKLPSLVQKSVQHSQKQNVVLQLAKGNAPVIISKQNITPVTAAQSKTSPIVTQQKSPLLKQRPLLKIDTSKIETVVTPMSSVVASQQSSPVAVTVSTATLPTVQITQNKVTPCTRSLLLRPPAHSGMVTSTSVTPAHSTTVTPATHAQGISVPQRRGIVRVLSPAAPTAGKSLISPRSLLQQDAISTTNKRVSIQNIANIASAAQNVVSAMNVINTVPTISTTTAGMQTRTLQLTSGRTVQIATNQTVHLPSGQSVQLTPGHTLQLQLPTQSVRLPSGQTVQLASPQTVRALSKLSTSPRQPSPKPNQTQPGIPASSVQIAGQTVQIGGQSVQLTGHTVKLPSGQSVQVASQNLLSRGQVQLAGGHNLQTVQLTGQNMLGGQPVQISGQTVQLASGQTVQLPTLQLSGGQTVQLPSGQTLQLSGQTVQLANQSKPSQQVVRNQVITGTDKQAQPIVAKLLTNAQGQMISLENMLSGSRALSRVQKPATSVGGVRLLTAAGQRAQRPLLLTAAKPLHNIILQQSDGSTVRVTSTGGTVPTQAIVISNIGGQTVNTSSTSAPILKLQQVNPLQHIKLAQGIKLQQSTSSANQAAGASRSVVVDGQQLKLVSGRHVLARLVRPQQPPQHQ